MRPSAKFAAGSALASAALMALGLSTSAYAGDAGRNETAVMLGSSAKEAEKLLHQTFMNLTFEEFGPAPVHGPLYQALAGGKVIYFAPETEHLIFGAVYDRNGANLTALTQDAAARKRLNAIDPADALLIGPDGAPKVIEFTDPDCP